MTTVGFVALGKLGMPVAVAMAERGHTVIGYDIKQELIAKYKTGKTDLYEPNMDERLQKQLDAGKLLLTTELSDAVKNSEIIFIAVQTPHPEQLDGSIRFNHVRKDFDYSYLIKSCCDIAEIINKCDDHKVITIISTVLPGTTRDKIYPAMQEHCSKKIGHGWDLIYSPSFIAMGQTISDFVEPEFTLIGEKQRGSVAGDVVEKFYKSIHDSPIMRMTWAEAEGVKVWYNLFIGQKIMFANTVMHLCDKLGANCDVVAEALMKATDRLISPKYLRGGNVDAGGCLPVGQQVITYYGYKAIESIEKDELVLCRDARFHRVVKTYRRDYNGDLIRIRAGAFENLFTSEHPIHIYDSDKNEVVEITAGDIHAGFIQSVNKWYCILPDVDSKRSSSERNFSDKYPKECNNYLLTAISMVERINYRGEVFNLNIADEHNYIVGIGVVSNCHPRDSLAMSYNSDELGLGYNIFDDMMTVREKHVEWFADEIQKAMQSSDQQVVIMGRTYKPFTNLTYGSASVLLWHILQERNIEPVFYDPETDNLLPERRPSGDFIGTNWPQFRTFDFCSNSIVIDPWGMITDVPDDVKLISLGRREI